MSLTSAEVPASSTAEMEMRNHLGKSVLAAMLATSAIQAHASSYVVAWKMDGSNGTTTPEQALADLKIPGSALRTALGNPDAAYKLFATATPPGASWTSSAAENGLRQYLVLTYEAEKVANSKIPSLQSSGKFGYVGPHSAATSDFTAMANDQYFSIDEGVLDNVQYGFSYPNLTLLGWPSGFGWANLGMVDTGPYSSHPDLLRAFGKKSSFDFQFNQPGIAYWSTSVQGAHATHVAGIMAARANNPVPPASIGQGIAGICPTCTILSGAAAAPNDRANSARILSAWGAQVVNLSGFIRDAFAPVQSLPTGTPCASFNYNPDLGAHPFCLALRAMRERGTVFVASAGNNKSFVLFPAIDPLAVAVAGARNGTNDDGSASNQTEQYQWNESRDPLEAGDWPNGCPQVYNPTSSTTLECGTNTGPEIDFAAPARHVISTFPPGANYATGVCSDANFGTANDGYAWCTGTSMAAPAVTALFGLMASAKPLVLPADLISELKWQMSGQLAPQYASLMLGNSAYYAFASTNGTWLTPMFVARLADGETNDRIYSAKPQVMQAALFGEYLAYPVCNPTFGCIWNATDSSTLRPYTTSVASESSPVLAGSYTFPIASVTTSFPAPQSSFYVFSEDVSPWPSVPLLPLYRLSITSSCDKRNTVYTTDPAEFAYFEGTDFCVPETGTQSYGVEGIEGYVMASCPPGYSGCTNFADGSAPQPLYRRAIPGGELNALILGSQISQPQFSGYAAFNGHDILGYVFPNVDTDSDKLIDGHERLLGTNRFVADSDCDSVIDGDEVSATRAPRLNTNPLGGGCG